MIDEERVRVSVAAMLEAVGDNPHREGLRDTPQRVARMYSELLAGMDADPMSALDTTFQEEEPGDGAVVVRDVPFFSLCEHHLLPFFGRAHVGYVPDGKLAGISKVVRALEVLARRLQLQERMTAQLADAVQGALDPDGTAVVLEAEHLCMTMRGVRKPGSAIVTSATRGRFDRRGISRSELLSMVQGRSGWAG